MLLFDRIDLTKAVYSCPERLKQIGKSLTLSQDSNHNQMVAKFVEAANSYDASMVNKMIEDALVHYLGTDYLKDALREYCKKVGVDGELSELNERELLERIACERDRIDCLLRQNNV